MLKKVGWLAVAMVCLLVSNLQAGVHPLFWKNHQSRQQEARGWLDGFKKLDAQIPTLSPAEQRWLQTEYDDEIENAKGHFTKRSLDAMNSKITRGKDNTCFIRAFSSKHSGPKEGSGSLG